MTEMECPEACGAVFASYKLMRDHVKSRCESPRGVIELREPNTVRLARWPRFAKTFSNTQ